VHATAPARLHRTVHWLSGTVAVHHVVCQELASDNKLINYFIYIFIIRPACHLRVLLIMIVFDMLGNQGVLLLA
jgi:hypothetical protein